MRIPKGAYAESVILKVSVVKGKIEEVDVAEEHGKSTTKEQDVKNKILDGVQEFGQRNAFANGEHVAAECRNIAQLSKQSKNNMWNSRVWTRRSLNCLLICSSHLRTISKC